MYRPFEHFELWLVEVFVDSHFHRKCIKLFEKKCKPVYYVVRLYLLSQKKVTYKHINYHPLLIFPLQILRSRSLRAERLTYI